MGITGRPAYGIGIGVVCCLPVAFMFGSQSAFVSRLSLVGVGLESRFGRRSRRRRILFLSGSLLLGMQRRRGYGQRKAKSNRDCNSSKPSPIVVHKNFHSTGVRPREVRR